jgi:hypothetical protein
MSGKRRSFLPADSVAQVVTRQEDRVIRRSECIRCR